VLGKHRNKCNVCGKGHREFTSNERSSNEVNSKRRKLEKYKFE